MALTRPSDDTQAVAVTEAVLTRDQRRSRRAREVRSKTIATRQITRLSLAVGAALYPPDNDAPAKPKTRGECLDGPRPCPFVSCKHQLFLEVNRYSGSIRITFPDLEPEELGESCALDVADRGGATLEGVGALTNTTRERVRQVEVRALAKLQRLTEARALRDFADPGAVTARHLPVLPPEDDINDLFESA